MSVKVIECLLEIAMYLQARSVDLSEILVKCLEIKRIKDVK